VAGWTLLAAQTESVVADANQVVGKHANMGWEQAGALSASGLAQTVPSPADFL